MSSTIKIKDLADTLTDYVANGSFASIRQNVHYQSNGYARLIRLVDYNKDFSENESVWVDEHGYNFLKKSRLYGGEIIISNVGEYAGKAFICPKLDYPMTLAPNSIMLRTKENDLFYYYYFISETGYNQIRTIVNSSGQPKFNKTNFKELEVPHPPLAIQNKIAGILSVIDNKILANNKIVETSEKLMHEIYDYWFVQFDFPDENGRPYKSSGGEMVYNEILKREIPKGWKAQNLLKNDLCKDIKPGIDKFDGTKTYYATADVINGEMGVGAQIDYSNRESRANMQPKPNSVWFAKMKNSIKHITVMSTSDDLLEDSVFSTGFFGLKCESETLPYIRNFIYSDYFEKVKDLNSNGATMEAISNDGVRNVKLLIPDEITLKKYSEAVGACLSQNDTLRKENAKLISLRDWLLPMLMNGQVKITN